MSSVVSPFAQRRRFFVCSPGDCVTGGPELLHQLVAEMRRMGREASIVYLPMGQPWQTPEVYARYGCPVSPSIPDEDDVAVIVPEICTRLLHHFKRAARCIWWLSVDNYRGNFDDALHRRIWLKRRLDSAIRRADTIIHLFQSRYAADFVGDRFGAGGYFLSDYLADEFAQPVLTEPRTDVVLYNPKKGIGMTRRIMAQAPDIDFVPLINMSRAEMRSALTTAKVYIDFGFHPGKDRIPREAAMCGCVVVVGLRGSACNDHDIPISSVYKLPASRAGASRTATLLREVLRHYPQHRDSQQDYREIIGQERPGFALQVEALFQKA